MIRGIGNVWFLTYSQPLNGQDPVPTLVNFCGNGQPCVSHLRQVELSMRDESTSGSTCSSLLVYQNHTSCFFISSQGRSWKLTSSKECATSHQSDGQVPENRLRRSVWLIPNHCCLSVQTWALRDALSSFKHFSFSGATSTGERDKCWRSTRCPMCFQLTLNSRRTDLLAPFIVKGALLAKGPDSSLGSRC